MEITVQMGDIDKFISNLGGIVGKARIHAAGDAAVAYTARKFYTKLRAATPVYTGRGGMGGPHTRDVWKLQAQGTGTWKISNDSPKLEWLLQGTQAHTVTALHPAFALSFAWKGQEWLLETTHPRGSRPNEQLKRAVEEAQQGSTVSVNDLRDFIRRFF